MNLPSPPRAKNLMFSIMYYRFCIVDSIMGQRSVLGGLWRSKVSTEDTLKGFEEHPRIGGQVGKSGLHWRKIFYVL